MRILLDTNVILDVLLNRETHVRASSSVWAAVEAKDVEGVLAAHAVTTIHYLVRKEAGTARANRFVELLLSVFGVAVVDGAVVRHAVRLAGADFEDAVTAAAASNAGCELIVTRDPKGFRASPVPAYTPEIATRLFIAP